MAEGRKERVDRELIELLNELRVALPGVQVLLAFLLTIPFTERFERLDTTDRRLFFAGVVCAALSCALLIAPSAHHRMRFRHGCKEQMVRVANRLALGGMMLLLATVALVVYVVADVVYGSTFAAVTGALLAAGTAALWFGAPLLYRPDSDAAIADLRGRPAVDAVDTADEADEADDADDEHRVRTTLSAS